VKRVYYPCVVCGEHGWYGHPGTTLAYCLRHFDQRLRKVTGQRAIREELEHETLRWLVRFDVNAEFERRRRDRLEDARFARQRRRAREQAGLERLRKLNARYVEKYLR
jgi:hypothetical protein